MATDQQRTRILTVVPKGEAIDSVAPFLSRSRIEIAHAVSGSEALALVTDSDFSLACALLPLPDMSVARLVTELRALGHPHHDLPLVLLASGPQLEAARIYQGPPVYVVGLAEGEDALRRVIAQSLGVAARLSVRVPIRLEIRLQRDDAFRFCETRNLSSSGMLVSARELLPIGTQFHFEMTLPRVYKPLAGAAEVVRHTEVEFEETTGFGARFLDFTVGDAARIESFVRREQVSR